MFNRYCEAAVVEAVTITCRDDELDFYSNDDEFLAKILGLMEHGFSGNDSQPRYNTNNVVLMLNVLRQLDAEVRRIVFSIVEHARHLIRLIAEGLDITDAAYEIAVSMV